jgi:hypothetical protein
MKKLIVSILALVYLSSSTGTSVDIHYCMGKLVDWTFSHKEAKSCSKCGMEKNGSNEGCCKDEQKFLKNTDDQKTASSTVQLFQLAGADLPVQQVFQQASFPVSLTEEYPLANAPPERGSVALHIRHCVFLI